MKFHCGLSVATIIFSLNLSPSLDQESTNLLLQRPTSMTKNPSLSIWNEATLSVLAPFSYSASCYRSNAGNVFKAMMKTSEVLLTVKFKLLFCSHQPCTSLNFIHGDEMFQLASVSVAEELYTNGALYPDLSVLTIRQSSNTTAPRLHCCNTSSSANIVFEEVISRSYSRQYGNLIKN